MEVTTKGERSHLPKTPLKKANTDLDLGSSSPKESPKSRKTELPPVGERASPGSPSKNLQRFNSNDRKSSKDSFEKQSSPSEGRARHSAIERSHSKETVDSKDRRPSKILVSQRSALEDFQATNHWADRDFVLKAVREDGWDLGKAVEKLRADREIVMEAVSRNGGALTYASQELKADHEIVLNAILSNASALADASEELRGDEEIVTQAIRIDGLTLAHASQVLKRDADLVLQAIAQDGGALAFAGDNLIESKEFILEALDVNWTCFKAAPMSSRGDPFLVREALELLENSNNGHQIMAWVPENLRSNTRFMSEVLAQSGQALQFGMRNIRANKNLVLIAVQRDPQSLLHASLPLRDDFDVVFEAVCRDGLALAHASKAMRADRDVVLAAVSQNRKATEYISKPWLLRDPELVEIVTSQATPGSSRFGTPIPGSRPGSRQGGPSSRPESRQSFPPRPGSNLGKLHDDDSGSEYTNASYQSSINEGIYAAYGKVLSSVLCDLKKVRKKHGLPTHRSTHYGATMPDFHDDQASPHGGPIVKASAEEMMAKFWNQNQETPKTPNRTSKQYWDPVSPKAEATTPKAEATTPKAEATTPKAEATTPKEPGKEEDGTKQDVSGPVYEVSAAGGISRA